LLRVGVVGYDGENEQDYPNPAHGRQFKPPSHAASICSIVVIAASVHVKYLQKNHQPEIYTKVAICG
jgi:hypothetical protein